MKSPTHLKFLRPFSNIVVVLAGVLGVEVGERAGVFFVVPHLSEDAGINVTHKNLAYGIKTMSYNDQYRGLTYEKQ